VRCLLDTHILLWWIEDDPKLGADLRATIAEPANEVVVSAATLWEAAIMRALGDLPRHHDDPFDRMHVAQAIAQGLTLITNDSRLRAYPVAVIEG
jgi:PIN domain nuclease of toxin-antitoxin system